MSKIRKDFNIHVFAPSTMAFDFQRRRILFVYHSNGTKTAVNREYKTTYRKHAPRKERAFG